MITAQGPFGRFHLHAGPRTHLAFYNNEQHIAVDALGFDIAYDPGVLRYTGNYTPVVAGIFEFFDVIETAEGRLRIGQGAAGRMVLEERVALDAAGGEGQARDQGLGVGGVGAVVGGWWRHGTVVEGRVGAVVGGSRLCFAVSW